MKDRLTSTIILILIFLWQFILVFYFGYNTGKEEREIITEIREVEVGCRYEDNYTRVKQMLDSCYRRHQIVNSVYIVDRDYYATHQADYEYFVEELNDLSTEELRLYDLLEPEDEGIVYLN